MRVEEKIAALLKGSGMTLSVAESCTGGMISHLITMVSGSSGYYLGSVTSYATFIKELFLEVDHETIEKYGVVSAEVAEEMASGIRRRTGSTFSVATTGLAEGGNEHYPEGTVWIGIAGPGGLKSVKYQCDLGRKGNIRRFANVALNYLGVFIQDYIKHCESANKTK